jgi:hypothetical protein
MPARRQRHRASKRRMIASTRTGPSMLLTKIALYRASLLADNLGIRLCAAALMVMPSVLVFLVPFLSRLSSAEDPSLAGASAANAGGAAFVVCFAIGIGFAAAWLRIVVTGARLLRKPALRLFVTGGLALGILALALGLTLPPLAGVHDDSGWLLLSALGVSLFLLAATLGQPRTDRLQGLAHRAGHGEAEPTRI